MIFFVAPHDLEAMFSSLNAERQARLGHDAELIMGIGADIRPFLSCPISNNKNYRFRKNWIMLSGPSWAQIREVFGERMAPRMTRARQNGTRRSS